MYAKIIIQGNGGEIDISKEDWAALDHFFSFLTPGFLKDGIGIISDIFRFKRLENLLKITKKAEEIKQKYNLSGTPLSLKTSVAYTEAASLEEDPTMQTMWANLLANISSAKMTEEVIYVSVLKELGPADATILNIFYSTMKASKLEHPELCTLSRDQLTRNIVDQTKQPTITLDNLVRQRLLQSPEKKHARLPMLSNRGIALRVPTSLSITPTNEDSKKIFEYLRQEERNEAIATNMLELTTLGYALVKACNEPEAK